MVRNDLFVLVESWLLTTGPLVNTDGLGPIGFLFDKWLITAVVDGSYSLQ